MKTTDFGFSKVAEEEKARRVADVFDSVAGRYDLMNDLMSGGMHRLWKRFTIDQSGVTRPGQKVLDIAGGTGDLARLFLERVGPRWHRAAHRHQRPMLARGRDRMLDKGRVIEVVRCDAERLPFPDRSFDIVSVAFGLRNMTHKDRALAEMYRVLRPGGRLLVLEFSKVWSPLDRSTTLYTMQLLPVMGKLVANDSASYRYLAESIAKHPDQDTLKQMMLDAGFERVEYFNLAARASSPCIAATVSDPPDPLQQTVLIHYSY
jgi:demethylmenaquinone methyltransferase / 2-methoxy-6-polyprenyl-1,4-benzoquinol methylase